ncbi:AzlC family ABC transporter permease [Streptomyces albidoflavus]|uniref:AzlC family ABC transporter permease n=1 Tax=Streptomyces albidoflavus TaxID=1886 RepID=UPI001A91EE1A
MLAALKDSASVGLGLVPMGLAFGMLVTQAGLPWWSAPMFSGVLYTGAFEFLLVPLVASAAPLVTVALTALLVNARHAFYALSFPLHRVRGRFAKAYSTFTLSDEAYAMTTGNQASTWTSARLVTLQGLMHLYCIAGSAAGALVGSLLPDSITGLEFAMTALLAVLALDAIKERQGDAPTPLLALLAALIARVTMPDQMLLAAFLLFAAALLARYLAAHRRTRRA